ncbi:hypothetical protein JIN78_16705 [Roseibacillus ishigakijimensis]|uniref:Uncharacterized protein n=1 Tax=Roseibacillus ishigakijimensis TaxID=454146 RepID=A0A934RU42_9BACT|nr:hypothetical protein [Roseibacillus ishigakijimensis]MBK1835706.1 hypothetical protein [Roseibacillus ishigakijimensis]
MSEVHRIYWRSEIQSEHAMIFFLEDGGLIFGFSTPAEDDGRVAFIADELDRFNNTEAVFVTYEDLPPETSADFISFFQSLPTQAARHDRAHRLNKGEQTTEAN